MSASRSSVRSNSGIASSSNGEPPLARRACAQLASATDHSAPLAGAAAPAPPVVAAPAPSPEPVVPPSFNAAYLNNPPPEYPRIARRNREQGRVMVRVLVNEAGRPERIELGEGSGSSLLDQAALDVVRQWRFVPARRGQTPVSAWVLVPIVFRLDA